MSQTRQLAAIMFTDIVGYTALMGSDEKRAFQLLKKNREIQKPLIKQYNGTWIKELGDGVLASFHTATDAVYCAAAIHKNCDLVDGLKLRIGIHLGEVVFENNDVFGDGVNIASRLQSIAAPGEIIVSEAVYTNIKNKKEFTAEFIREETLKNVESPVKSYRIRIEPSSVTTSVSNAYRKSDHRKGKFFNEKKFIPLILGFLLLLTAGFFFYFKNGDKSKSTEKVELKSTDKSIAVLPFTNMSNDPAQDYFADAMMDEILNHLFKIGGWRITSRTSAMSYKGSKKTMKEIANELGVRNLLEASVQLEGDIIRIRVRLIDGKTDEYLWTETYDRKFKEVFAIQSEIAQTVAAELKVKINPDVKSRIEFIPTENISAYNLYLLSKEKVLNDDKSWKEFLERVIQLDPSFAPAYADLALYWLYRGSYAGDLNAKQVLDSALPLLRRSIQLDSNLSSAHNYMALAHLWYEWDFKTAEHEWEKFFQLSPSGIYWADSYVEFLYSSGRFQQALEFSLRNREHDKNNFDNWSTLAFSYFHVNQPDRGLAILDSAWIHFKEPLVFRNKARLFIHLGKYQQAVDNLNEFFEVFPDDRRFPRLQAWLAISYFHTGRMLEAQKIVDSLQSLSKELPVGSPAFHIAMIYTATRRTELALQWLQKAYTDHEVEMYWLKEEPLFKPLQNDPRFKELLKKIGFK